MTDNLNVLLNKLNNHNTSHGWHFIASLLTGGLWVIMWILFTLGNAIERGKIERKIEKLLAAHVK
ncbi:MAG: hypothetical protein ACRCUH_10230 [Shewanella sp.]